MRPLLLAMRPATATDTRTRMAMPKCSTNQEAVGASAVQASSSPPPLTNNLKLAMESLTRATGGDIKVVGVGIAVLCGGVLAVTLLCGGGDTSKVKGRS